MELMYIAGGIAILIAGIALGWWAKQTAPDPREAALKMMQQAATKLVALEAPDDPVKVAAAAARRAAMIADIEAKVSQLK